MLGSEKHYAEWMQSRQDRLDSLGERGKHRQADGGVSDVKLHGSAQHDSGTQQLIPWRGSGAGNVIPMPHSVTPRTQHRSWCQTPSSPSYCTVADRRSILLNRGCALDDILTALSAFPAGHQQDRTRVAVGQYSGGEDLSTIIDIRPLS